MAPQTPSYLNEAEAAQYLGVSVKSLRRWRFDRRGPTYSKILGKLVRYTQQSLDSWMDEQTISHDPQ